jgi:hypothetical protein
MPLGPNGSRTGKSVFVYGFGTGHIVSDQTNASKDSFARGRYRVVRRNTMEMVSTRCFLERKLQELTSRPYCCQDINTSDMSIAPCRYPFIDRSCRHPCRSSSYTPYLDIVIGICPGHYLKCVQCDPAYQRKEH